MNTSISEFFSVKMELQQGKITYEISWKVVQICDLEF